MTCSVLQGGSLPLGSPIPVIRSFLLGKILERIYSLPYGLASVRRLFAVKFSREFFSETFSDGGLGGAKPSVSLLCKDCLPLACAWVLIGGNNVGF